MEVKFRLDESQEKELKDHIYMIASDTLKQLEMEYGMNKRLMNKKEAAAFMNCSYQFLESMIQKEGLPFHRAGSKTYLDREEILDWLKQK